MSSASIAVDILHSVLPRLSADVRPDWWEVDSALQTVGHASVTVVPAAIERLLEVLGKILD
jgi:hypothetical protein